jgi:hypothetical protein
MELDGGYLTIARVAGEPGELRRLYLRSAETMNGVGRDHGLLVHAAAATEDGLLIVNVWPSRDASEAAARDPRRLGELAAAGIGPGQMTREHHPAAHVVVFEPAPLGA